MLGALIFVVMVGGFLIFGYLGLPIVGLAFAVGVLIGSIVYLRYDDKRQARREEDQRISNEETREARVARNRERFSHPNDPMFDKLEDPLV